jgi:hypothetical protein
MNIPQEWIEWARAVVLRALPPNVPAGMVEAITAYRRTEPLKDTDSYDGVSSQQG